MSEPAIKQTEQEPDVFFGTSFIVGELELGLAVLSRKVRDLKSGNERGSAVDQKLAAEQLAKTAGQMQCLADVVTRITLNYINRKPRV